MTRMHFTSGFAHLAAPLCALAFIMGTTPDAGAIGAGKTKNSEVVAKAQVNEKGHLVADFTITFAPNLIVNMEGPWKLDIKKAEGLSFSKTSYPIADFDQKKPGFIVTTADKPMGKSGTIEYQLVAFVCTKNKEICYRDAHKGELAWKAP